MKQITLNWWKFLLILLLFIHIVLCLIFYLACFLYLYFPKFNLLFFLDFMINKIHVLCKKIRAYFRKLLHLHVHIGRRKDKQHKRKIHKQKI